jgi:hypothetical protein
MSDYEKKEVYKQALKEVFREEIKAGKEFVGGWILNLIFTALAGLLLYMYLSVNGWVKK